jgi:hypothetical protein
MDAAVYVSERLDRFRNSDRDSAFFGLIHRELDLVPHLVQAYSSERDPSVKAFIVEVLWQQRGRLDPMPPFTRVPFALPRVVSGRGAGETVAPRLNNVEPKSLQQSASLVRKAIGPLQQVRGFA